jgi:PAS domain S-box-containing protein
MVIKSRATNDEGIRHSVHGAERQVKDARLWLAAIVDSSDDAIISKNLDGVILTWNLAAQRLFGYSEEEAVGHPITIIIPPELHDEERDILRRLRAGERIEHRETRRITRGGRHLDVSLTISPVRNAQGRIIGASKILRDITDRKRAHEVLSTLSQRLIVAQEDERARLARELHDDINQQLGLLAMRLDGLLRAVPASVTDGRQQIEEARQDVLKLVKDVHDLSHRLYPPRLEYLGIETAAAALCREISSQQNVEVSFAAECVPGGVPKRIVLCLYRVLQEALQNAIKHSGTRKVAVSLRGEADHLVLTVDDFGVGFDLETNLRRGLGMTSMNERLKAVDGQLAIRSQLQRGTSIRARVPIRRE